MWLAGTHVRTVQIALILLLNLAIYQKSEALFISIENIGGSPIVAASFHSLLSHLKVLHLSFTSFHQELEKTQRIFIYNLTKQTQYLLEKLTDSPRIPELTGVTLTLMAIGISGFNIGTAVGFGPGIPLIPRCHHIPIF